MQCKGLNAEIVIYTNENSFWKQERYFNKIKFYKIARYEILCISTEIYSNSQQHDIDASYTDAPQVTSYIQAYHYRSMLILIMVYTTIVIPI